MNAQCSIPGEVGINDKDTTIVNFLIEGAQANDLAVNGVCGFNIDFQHDFVGDVSIILVSPSGQEVQLIGPSLQTSPNTQFVRWDVTFIPCGFSANPDPGIPSIWNNINNWFQFTTYSGNYYPSIGCLEDLNSGPVNGVWSIKVIDAVDFGSGMITDMDIIFCDPSGIDCEPCEANAGSLVNSDASLCEGQEELLIEPVIDFGPDSLDVLLYDFFYLVFNEDQSIMVDSVDLRNSLPGTYEICGLAVSNTQTNMLPLIDSIKSRNEYVRTIEDLLLCASVSNQCFTVEIIDVQDTILIQDTICQGEIYEINGNQYTSEGSYVVGYSGVNCDTVSLLDLAVYNINASIDQQIDSLSCAGNSVLLNGSGSTADGTLNYRWFTDQGLFRSDTISSSVLVSQVGNYFLEITSGSCVDTDTISVLADDSFIELDFNFDVLDCNNQSSLIEINSNQILTNVRWDGPAAFSRVGDNIVVSDPGTYLVTVTSVDGCTSMDSVIVTDGFDVIDPVIDPPIITCVSPQPNAGISISDTNGLAFTWSGPNGFSSTLMNPVIDTGGQYQLSITGSNGCTEMWNLSIMDDRQFPSLTTSTDSLDCANPQVMIGVTSSIQPVSYNWSGPNNFQSSDAMPLVDQDGIYTVSVTTIEQCVSTVNVEVERDEELPSLIANDVIISCVDLGSVNLNVTTDALNPVISWIGPGGYTAVGPNPVAGVIGTYSVTVMGSNGCPRTSTMDILPGPDIPSVSFFSDTLDCENSTQAIIPSDSMGLSFQYLNELGTTYSESSPITSESGTYFITVTDQSGCTAEYVHDLLIDTIIPDLTLNVVEIDCNNDSVQLLVNNATPIRSFTWNGAGGFSSIARSPWVNVAGSYTLEVIGTNGCLNSDSIIVIENLDLPQITTDSFYFTCIEDTIPIQAGVNVNNPAFSWSGPNGFSSQSERPLVIEPGDYYVTVTAPNGCKNQDSVSVDYDTIAPIVTLVNDGFLTCPDPIVTISGTTNESNTTSMWIGPDTVVNGGMSLDVTVAGVWQLIVTDESGCVGLEQIDVDTQIDYPDIVVNYNGIDCNMTTSTIEVQAGRLTDQLFWTSPIPIPQDTLSFETSIGGVYEILATGINGCDTIVTFEINVDTLPPDFDLSVSDTITCRNPEVSLNANLNSDIDFVNWSGPNGFISTETSTMINNGGSYQFQANGINGCVSSEAIFVEVDTIAPLVQASAEEITCIASKATLSAITNISDPVFNWTGPNDYNSDLQSPIAVTPGFYLVEVINTNGCIGSDEVELIADIEVPFIELDSISYLLCDSSGVNLQVSTDDINVTFNWFGDNFFSDVQRPFVDQEGEYTVFVTGSNGCRNMATTSVVVDTRKPSYLLSSSDINCEDSQGLIMAVDVDDDLNYKWEGPNRFISVESVNMVSDSGFYSFIIQGQNLCIDTQQVYVAIDRRIPEIVLSSDQLIQCESNELTLNAIGTTGAHILYYNWSTNDGTILEGEDTPTPVVREGTYLLEVVDSINKCLADTTVVIERTEQEFLDFILEELSPSCPGFKNGQINFLQQIGGYGPLEFSFNGGPILNVMKTTMSSSSRQIFTTLFPALIRLIIVKKIQITDHISNFTELIIFTET